MVESTNNVRVKKFDSIMTPLELQQELGLSETNSQRIQEYRHQIRQCLNGSDSRMIALVGPCSIHDFSAGIEYAKKLKNLQTQVNNTILIVMRVYFEKPRTTVGWKGLINDPHLDGSKDILTGLRIARKFLQEVSTLGMPSGTEFLDPVIPQYISDLVSWVAIGARTTESQTHRELASGLSMPVGFKNATDGDLQVALDAMVSARSAHAFLGIDENGQLSVVNTMGNEDVHVILRGGRDQTNFDSLSIAGAAQKIQGAAGERRVLVDCSHGNSSKDFRNQPGVCKQVVQQYAKGQTAILGFMLESFLVPGKQRLEDTPRVFGQSITDGCLGWTVTEQILLEADEILQNRIF